MESSGADKSGNQSGGHEKDMKAQMQARRQKMMKEREEAQRKERERVEAERASLIAQVESLKVQNHHLSRRPQRDGHACYSLRLGQLSHYSTLELAA